MTTPEIVTLEQARAWNLPTYFTGKPCRYGHMSPRFTGSSACIECNGERVISLASERKRPQAPARFISPPATGSASGFIKPVPRERLMARR